MLNVGIPANVNQINLGSHGVCAIFVHFKPSSVQKSGCVVLFLPKANKFDQYAAREFHEF